MVKCVSTEPFILTIPFLVRSRDGEALRISYFLSTVLENSEVFQRTFIVDPIKIPINSLAEHLANLDELQTFAHVEALQYLAADLKFDPFVNGVMQNRFLKAILEILKDYGIKLLGVNKFVAESIILDPINTHNPGYIRAVKYKDSRTNKVPVLILSIMLFIVAVCFAFYYFQSSAIIALNKETINSLEDNLATLNYQITSLTNTNQTLSNQITSLNTQVTSLTNTNRTYSDQITEFNTQVTSLMDTSRTYATQITSLTNQLKLYKDTYGSSVKSGESPSANGQTYTLIDNPIASDPSYNQLRNFILSDQTDKIKYIPDVYVCTDYAQDLHNNAEKAGIRAGWVGIDFKNQTVGHALNVFKTSDRGLVYIDCTGQPSGQDGPSNNDKTVNLKMNTSYLPTFLFSSDWYIKKSLGTVSDIEIYW